MTDPADLVVTNAEVHTLGQPDEIHEALAVRDTEIVRVGSTDEIGYLVGVETRVVDLEGSVVLPGFIDAHTHLETLGRRLVHADLSAADSHSDAVYRLRESASDDREWVLGYGYDESGWDTPRYLTRNDLDDVSQDRPVAAFREDMHTASLNSVALDRHVESMPTEDVHHEGDHPTGVVVEEAVDVIYGIVAPDPTEMRELLLAAQSHANELGVTGVHEMVRRSHAPRVYRDLDEEGALTLRVRLNYWADHLDAVQETGLRTNAGSDLVRTGGIKTYTDGSIGGRTAKLSVPYVDDGGETPGDDGREIQRGNTGKWVVSPDDLREIVARADGADLQVCVHAIGDRAIAVALDAFENCTDDPAGARHRIEHAEVLTNDLVEQFAAAGTIASVQPNFLKWARSGGLYESRLGRERTQRSNRLRDLLDAGVPLAFGSDCMPLNPLFGIEQAVTAPAENQRLSVTEAVRAYTGGGARAGFQEHRLGMVKRGMTADLVGLDRSPWSVPSSDIGAIDVILTTVAGTVVYDGRE